VSVSLPDLVILDQLVSLNLMLPALLWLWPGEGTRQSITKPGAERFAAWITMPRFARIQKTNQPLPALIASSSSPSNDLSLPTPGVLRDSRQGGFLQLNYTKR
jgi:hypothetical protein